MRLQVLVCSLVLLTPTHADGDYKEARDYTVSDIEGGERAKHAPSHTSGSGNQNAPFNKWADLSGDMTLITDYLFRGQTQTLGGPAAQGGFTVSQKNDQGLYGGAWGSNVSNTTASNGSGLELCIFAGYVYKRDNDLSLKLEIRNTSYPGAYASLPTKDKFDYLEIIPGVTYKFFSLFLAYSVTNRSGVNQNFAPTFAVPLTPNGNSKGSWYTEASINLPISFIDDQLQFQLLGGYSYTRNYTVLNYAVFGTGVNYKLPESWGGISLSVNISTTTANKKYFKVKDSSGKVTNTVASKVFFSVSKKF
ncbi:MAG: hypothetical protein K0R76_350 [Alphaproteobacteria bacterium]|jgi:uncharacterized protein (TIGR02001 family)|nr:hypothetical protein [Alphaproteobacteria bacterium]